MSESSTRKRFLITGATGNTGNLVANELLRRGESVRCLTRDAEKAAALADAGAEIVVGDLDHPETLGPAFTGIDSVYLVTATGPNTVAQAMNGINAARAAGVSYLVRYSILDIPGELNVRSSRFHKEVEAALPGSGLAYCILRSTNYMQNLLGYIPTIQSDSAIYVPWGEGRVGMVDVRDIAEAAVEVLTTRGNEGKTYSITGPKAINLHEAAAAISGAIGKQVNYVDVPPEAAKQGLKSMGLDAWTVDEYMSFFNAFKNNHATLVTDDFEKLTGHAPHTINDFARDFAAIFVGEPVAR